VPEVRLFAQARDAAGMSSATVEGSTVAQVLDALVARFGPAMGEVVGISDEVAVLPPVSGGCG
jgi:molybdopterin converting factor small subunit